MDDSTERDTGEDTVRDTGRRKGRPPKGEEEHKPLSTDSELKALKPKSGIYEHAIDGCPGLRIKVSPTGRKSWYFRSRHPATGKLQKLVIGYYPGMTLKQARDKVGALRADARHTLVSPKESRDTRKAERRAEIEAAEVQKAFDAKTLATLIDAYLRFISDQRNKGGKRGRGFVKSHREVARTLDRYILGRQADDVARVSRTALGNTPAAAVTAKQIKDHLDDCLEDTPVQYNRALAYLGAAFNWEIRRQALDPSPTITTNPCAFIEANPESPKERFLSVTEMRNFLQGLAATDIHQKIQQILRVMLLTGLRSKAAANLRAEFIEADHGTILIPGDYMKSGRPFLLPLTPQVKKILDATGVKSGLFFPTAYGNAFTSNEIARELRAALPKLKVFGFTPHTLRKTFVTQISNVKDENGKTIPMPLKGILVDYAEEGVTRRHYDFASYLEEKRLWHGLWAAYIEGLEKSGEKENARAEAAA